jgi:predicted DNA-binding protein
MDYLEKDIKPKKTKAVSFRLPEELWKDLKFLSWKEDQAVSDFLNWLLFNYLNGDFGPEYEDYSYERKQHEIKCKQAEKSGKNDKN